MGITGMALEVFAAIVTAVLIIAALGRKNIFHKPDCFILYLTCAHFLLLLCDIGTEILRGHPETLTLLKTIWILDYFFALADVSFFHCYLVHFLSQKKKISIKLIYISTAIFAVMMCLWIISMSNGMFYVIDKNADYFYTDYYIISQLGAVVILVMDLVLILMCWKILGGRDTAILLTYILLPCFMIALEENFDVIPMYLAMTVSLMIIYIMLSAEQDKKLAKNEIELSENRMRIMISQIQPHFLYNSLASIAQLCEKDPKKAKETTIAFSEYLRHNMNSLKAHNTVPFDKEFEHLRTYLSIEQMRFGDALKVEYRIEATDFSLPVLTLQPIVENAVKHGIGQKEDGGTVAVSTKDCKNHIEIIISDDGMGFDAEEPPIDLRSHIGIENVRQRLSMMCGGTMDIKSQKGVGTTVTITIPKEAV